MITYSITVSYDGTDYYGWQIQPDRLTVNQVLVDAFKSVFNRAIKITGASRTDAGVHALGQVASFETDLILDPATLKRAWNGALPPSVFIRSVRLSESLFNPRFNVEQKTYYYHFSSKRLLPIAARYCMHVRMAINYEKLNKALAVFVGTHDFRSFCTAEEQGSQEQGSQEQGSTVRRIDSITLSYLSQFRCYRITVKGPGFLKYMLRRIIGACIEVATLPDLSPEDLVQALAEKNPHQQFTKAPAHGLMLAAIRYT
jgi:tRNA pseudouridine38-40 synthase